ncbi:MAG: hypothetical protein HOQ00_09625, partial [Agromyces sp.]|nr:hypothetical protein [Agromyces sp.]
MTKYLVLYVSPTSAQEQIANATPEEGAAGMEAWTAWAGRVGPALVDLGSPTMAVGSVVSGSGSAAGDGYIGGFSIMEAESADAVRGLLADHPHLMLDGASIEVLEFLELPGMG